MYHAFLAYSLSKYSAYLCIPQFLDCLFLSLYIFFYYQMPTGNIIMFTGGVGSEGGISGMVYDSLIDDRASHGTEDCALEMLALDADSTSGGDVTTGVGGQGSGGDEEGKWGGGVEATVASIECVKGQMSRVREMLQGMLTCIHICMHT